MDSQILAVSEMLMGLMEEGSDHEERACVAMKLVPGEFSARLVSQVTSGAELARAEGALPARAPVDAAGLARRMKSLGAAIGHARALRADTAFELQKSSPELRQLIGMRPPNTP